ncbi:MULTISPECIES: single-stranded DNA-binding protein [Staphylococcus]|uniref:Single-stranded DNA-binding protein n=1 Tax=Staphylococcus ureilyticus TaxID=94138 RepID=A0AB34AF98_STAUR|nr:single-stranded DNA-binding protein [Staphylococcus ureilyticus]QKU17406.1 single-stranded DNA-binding protein [Staphylococcus cohnii]MCT1914026.1 single-stranded DNA-binding protein [Staphylococcus ureilyticus]OJT35350.1 single-stranded DNA-binding protein [Staphylococcus ureilyticus]PNZ47790.1 single-stranded DNA-binding protein [Staphylococcus ureilyticus]GEQ01950.1 single-stranded DNA-binding protein [Staphylococcus ureilyticus]
MNQFNGVGNLVADPELKGQNNNVVNFRVAIQRAFKNKQTGEYETDFLTCVAFGKTAEIIANNFSKGQKIGITGSVQTGSYENKEGNRVFTTDIAVNQVTFVERKQQGNKPQQAQAKDNPFANGGADISEDSLPF